MSNAFARSVALLTMLTAVLVAASGCGANSLSKLYGIPTPPPSPVVNVTPGSVTLSMSHSNTATITASETGGTSTSFTAQTSDGSKATVALVSGQNNVFTVTAAGVGSCKIIVSDGLGDSANVAVTVGK